MKLRALLKRFGLRSLSEGDRPVDNVDAMASAMGQKGGPDFSTGTGPSIPPGYVPSQQDWGKPRH